MRQPVVYWSPRNAPRVPTVSATPFDPGPRPLRLARLFTWFWLAVVLAIFASWLVAPERYTQAAIAEWLEAWGSWAFAGFALVSIVRGALLVPSTPFILAGAALFPDALWAVFAVSMLGIVASATLLYRFPGFAGYDAMLAAKYPEKLARLQVELVKPKAMWFIVAWAFFPAVPTDLICYAAGLVRMPYPRMILGIIAGEVPLVAVYCFVGTRLLELLPAI